MDVVERLTGIPVAAPVPSEESFDAIPHPDRDAMYRQFEESPGDFTAYGVIADILDELGYRSLGYAFRWMSRRCVYPHKRGHYTANGLPVRAGRAVPKTFRWAWYQQREDEWKKNVSDVFPVVSRAPHSVPRSLLFAPHRYYPSHQAAVMDLAKWLTRLKQDCDLEPPTREERPC